MGEIEVGHDSEVRKEPTPEGLTHNWKVFVRGKNTKNIGSFVESIEFKLHESFSNNYRRVREHPFQVKEKGYAGFLIPIKINFRNGIHADFTYDLYLSNNRNVSSVRVETLTFQNPSPDFREQVLQSKILRKNQSIKRKTAEKMKKKRKNAKKIKRETGKKRTLKILMIYSK